MPDFEFMSPSFVNLWNLGSAITDDAQRAIEARVPEEARRQHTEQIERVLRGEKSDYVPFTADLAWWFQERWHAGTLERDLEGVDLSCLGFMLHQPSTEGRLFRMELEPGSSVETRIHWCGTPIRYVNGGYPGDTRVLEILTPRGNLQAVETYSTYSFGITEYPIKSVQDLQVYRYILEHLHVRAVPLGSRGRKRHLTAPKTPLQGFLVELAGIANTAYLMADAPTEMEDAIELITSLERQIMQIAVDSEVDSAGMCENLSSEVGGAYWDRYTGPMLAEWGQKLHARGKRLDIHMDGTLRPLLGRLHDVGVDRVNGITAAPIGDIAAEEIRKVAGDQLLLQDILPNSLFTPVFSEAEFEAFVRRVISHFRDDYRVILGIGDMLPVDGLIKRVEKVVRLTQELTAR